MSLENVGIGGILSFNGSQAIAGMASATSATARLAEKQDTLAVSAAKVGGAFSSIGGYAVRAGLAFAPFGAALLYGEKLAADFEQQMSAVGAITRANATDMGALSLKAKQLGVSSVFTATEVGQAMEAMGRAGASTSEILGGVDGVIAAAAADAIPLGTAADIIAQVVRGMGLAFSDANRVADVLAITSARTNTDIIGLGEAFKYAGAEAHIMKIPLETTAALLGAAADSGLRGSIGGSSFAAMLVKLAKPSKEANHWLKANNIEMKKTADGGLDVVSVITQITNKLEGQKDVLKKAAVASELFGVRGQKAFSAISQSIEQGRLPGLLKDIQNSTGAAAEMAAKRLDNLKGALKLASSSLESFAIETAGAFGGPATKTIREMTDGLNKVISVMQVLNGTTEANRAELEEKYGPTATAIAYGIKDAIVTVVTTLGQAKEAFLSFFQKITGDSSPELIQSIAKWATVLFLVAAAAGPILVVLGGIATFIGGTLIPIAVSLGEVVGGVFTALTSGPVLAFGVAIGLLFLTMRNEGESVGSVFERMWTMVTDLGHWFMDEALMPMVNIFLSEVKPAIVNVQKTFSAFVDAAGAEFKSWFGGIYRAMQALAPLFSAIFKILGVIVASFVDVAVTMFGWILDAITPVLHVVKEVGLWILNVLLKALQKAISFAMQASAALGIDTSGPIWQDLATFASNKIDVVTESGQAQNKAAIEGAGKKPPTVAEREHGNTGADVFAKEAAQNVAAQKAAGAAKPNVDVNVDVQDKRSLEVKNCMTVDGRELAVAQGRHRQEINERAGFRATPYQRRQIAEQGAAPVGGVGGS